MCFVQPPKIKKPPVITPPSDDQLQQRRSGLGDAAKRGLLSTQRTGAQGLLSAAPTAPKTLLGGP